MRCGWCPSTFKEMGGTDDGSPHLSLGMQELTSTSPVVLRSTIRSEGVVHCRNCSFTVDMNLAFDYASLSSRQSSHIFRNKGVLKLESLDCVIQT